MWVVILLTVGWVLSPGSPTSIRNLPSISPGAFDISPLFFVGLGVASLNAIYDYGGYNNVCFFGGEVQNPGRNVPRAVLWSIAAVAVMYLVMTVTIIGVVPWREAVTPGTSGQSRHRG
jgi:amino acid transporter